MARRTAKEIIDAALADNRGWERLCFWLVVVFVGTGTAALVVGIITERDLLAVTGGGVATLFFQAMWFARSFRRDNVRIRLYEIPLSLAKTSAEAADLVQQAISGVTSPPGAA